MATPVASVTVSVPPLTPSDEVNAASAMPGATPETRPSALKAGAVIVTGASGARRWTESVYVSDAPDSAVTVSVTVFTPTLSAYSPVPATLAAALSGEAVTVMRSVSFER